MNDASAEDFGTGLRAHLGLDEPELTELDVAIAKVEHVLEPVAEPRPAAGARPRPPADPIAAREAALEEREYQLALREANLAGRAATHPRRRAGALRQRARRPGQPTTTNDELARLRRRKTVA